MNSTTFTTRKYQPRQNHSIASNPRPPHENRKLLAFRARLELQTWISQRLRISPRETHRDAAPRQHSQRAHADPPLVKTRAEGQVAADEEESGGGAEESRGEPRPLAVRLQSTCTCTEITFT